MSIARFYSPLLDLDQILDEAFRSRVRNSPASYEEQSGACVLKPRMNLHEDADQNLLTASFELPGLSKDEVDIDVQNGNLNISGEVSEPAERNQHGYLVHERKTGKFTRSVKLPEGTNPQDIKAAMENGVLTVTFPRSPPGQEPQRITIN